MNIAINARFLHHPFGGIGQYLLGIIDAYKRSTHPDHLFLYTHLPTEDIWKDERIHIRVVPEFSWIPSAGARKTLWEITQFPKAIEQDKPAVGFIPYPSCTTSRSIPFVHCVHDVIPWVEKEYRKGILSRMYHDTTKKILKKEQHLLTVSKFSQQEIAQVLERAVDDISVVHPGSCFDVLPTPTQEEIAEVRKKHGLFRPYVLYVGGYDKRKGVDELLTSYLEYVAPYYDMDLVLVGHPLFRSGLYMDPKSKSGVGERGVVRPIGAVPTNQELYALYAGAHGFVSFSGYEGFNLPLLQACKAHIPSLVFPIPPHEELFKKTFVSLMRGDQHAMWKEFLFDKDKRARLVERTKLAASHYHFDQTLSKLLTSCSRAR